jgi:head-tail adaptor
MRLGPLNRRITIRRASAPARNALNEPIASWSNFGTFWAEEDARRFKGSEGLQAGGVRAQALRCWRLRWSARTATISPADRVACGGVTYEIVSATEIGRREGVEIVAIGPVADIAGA